MSEFRIDQIKSQDASRGPDIAGITTFTGTSGIVMPSGDTFRREVIDNIVAGGLTCYIDATNRDCYNASISTDTLTDLSIHRTKNNNLRLFEEAEFVNKEGGFFRLKGSSDGSKFGSGEGAAIASGAHDDPTNIDNVVAQTPKLDVSGFIVVRMGGNLDIGTFKHQIGKYTGASQLISTRGAGSNEFAFLIHGLNNYGFVDSKGIARSSFSIDRYAPSGGGANTKSVTFPFDGEWHFCAFSATHSSHVRFFIDGKWEQVAHTETFSGINSNVISFGAQTPGGDFNRIITGDIAAAGLYSGRALSDGEIEQNYQVFKERYGL